MGNGLGISFWNIHFVRLTAMPRSGKSDYSRPEERLVDANTLTKLLMWSVGGLVTLVIAVFSYTVRRSDKRYDDLNKLYQDLDKDLQATQTDVKLLEKDAEYIKDQLAEIKADVKNLPDEIARRMSPDD